MVYAFNNLNDRIALWSFLKQQSQTCVSPWLWLGDFNAVLSPIERLGGTTTEAEMEHFQECVSLCGMEDINATWALYTWSNKQEPTARVYSRLDRAMGNQEWIDEFGDYIAHFHPEGLFDHCPCTVVNRKAEFDGRRSFKYFNMWGASESFKEQVASVWQQKFKGTRMFSVVKKLKALKPVLKKLNTTCFSDIENSTTIASRVLEEIQEKDSFLTQKAKLQWSLEGDLNTSYFHRAIKKRIMLNKVFQIEDMQGVLCTKGATIQNSFLAYYQKLLGTQNPTDAVNVAVLLVLKLKLVYLAFQALLSQVNATVITLIPKNDRPTSVVHYRPISCCNVLYKVISKILCARLALVLPDIISKNQGAFVKGRSILENILICQDLVRMYNRKAASPRCMFKLDLQKAYDSIEWGFLEQMLVALNFPEKFRHLILQCVTTPSYTLNLNGTQFGFFAGRRGLRQGDPISPLLFCVSMEYLSRVMNYAVGEWYFKFHPLCKSLKLTHLLFADDLLMFCKGDHQSIMLILRVLATFTPASGLRVNASKSEVVFNGVTEVLRQDITFISGFQEGVLPFKYLVVPIQAGRLTKHDCNILVERIVAKIRGIGARKLSYAGRIILINSVFNTLHNYWCSIFLLPKCIIKKIEALCRNFLLNGDAMYQRTPLVAWDSVCCSKKEGGLGVKNAGVWNIATVGKLVNWIYTKADRLWVLWVDHIYMKGADWYTYSPPPDSNWNWRNICKVKAMLAAGWLIQRKALNTRDKLFQHGISGSNCCVFCELAPETHDHLFSDCIYNKQVISLIEHWMHLRFQTPPGHCPTVRRKVWRVIKLSCWYVLWMERNTCRIELKLRRPELLVSEIQKTVQLRVQQKMSSIIQQMDVVCAENVKVRCRPNGLVNLVKQLGPNQRKAIIEIGFGALLDFKVNKLSLADVFLLPNDGDKVEVVYTGHSFLSSQETLKAKFQNKFNVEAKNYVRIPAVYNAITGMGDDGGDEFQKLFVLYAMSVVLAPPSNYAIDFSILKALQDVSRIHHLDWCDYVFDKLVDGVERCRTGSSTLRGCVLVVMVA
ncbi:uncharacterized protein LOC141650580 [Silene latifolia]|uniref:uncharacterized protein LOC141650580 n=1 Tax=Silene latifolia TaxID=37657 RepID=UPI003D788AD2